MKPLILLFLILLCNGCKNGNQQRLGLEYKHIAVTLTHHKKVKKLNALVLKQVDTDSLNQLYRELETVDTELKKTNTTYLGLYAVGMENIFSTPSFKNWSFKGFYTKASGSLDVLKFNYGTLINENNQSIPNVICVEPYVPRYFSFRVYYFFKTQTQIELPQNKELNFTRWIEDNGYNYTLVH